MLFGGSSIDSGPQGDTWTWSGTTWNEVHAADNPAPRRVAAAAYDPASAQLVMFGGLIDGYKYTSETWGWNGRSWSHLDPASSPRQRSGGSEAFDAATGQFILFGGADGSNYLNDTWIWQLSS